MARGVVGLVCCHWIAFLASISKMERWISSRRRPCLRRLSISPKLRPIG
jgi:hypothetical protein